MDRQEKIILLILAAGLLVTVGGMSVRFTMGAEPGETAREGGKKMNAALRRTAADIWRPAMDEGAWSLPVQTVLASGADTLHANHPLFRRPCHAGENRHKIITGGWGGWFYDPPSEDYF